MKQGINAAMVNGERFFVRFLRSRRISVLLMGLADLGLLMRQDRPVIPRYQFCDSLSGFKGLFPIVYVFRYPFNLLKRLYIVRVAV